MHNKLLKKKARFKYIIAKCDIYKIKTNDSRLSNHYAAALKNNER
jgi:hypothetical protein